jgi:hypothetical protein
MILETEDTTKELPVTEGGFRFIELEDGKRLRESKVAYRLIEDGETYDEYKLRRSVMQWQDKQQRTQRPHWNSKLMGTFSKKRIDKALEDVRKEEEK